MDEKLQALLDRGLRSARQAGASAAEALDAAGDQAGRLLAAARRNRQISLLEQQVDEKLRQVGTMVYATHTGAPTGSEILLERLREIDRLKARIAALKAPAACPVCGAPLRAGDSFCRECGGKI
jgi:GAF domain-containing protein